MKIIGGLSQDYASIATHAKRFERLGLDAIAVAEMAHNAFLPLMLAAEHTDRLALRTSIAVAFSRNPMDLAMIAHDLQSFSGGRFTLGLGSQIQAHITKRFSMPWSAPAARMKEMVQAIGAIWDCWYDGAPLDFRGQFYTHTLMTEQFTPKDTAFARPRLIVAAVGPQMTAAAGEVADGAICHAFTTERYLRELTLPTIERARASVGKTRAGFEVTYPPFIAFTDGDVPDKRFKKIRQQIAFYASTPAYRGVLDLHGWGELQTELNVLSKKGEWEEMGERIDDEMFHTFVIVGSAAEVAGEISRKYRGLVDTIHLQANGLSDQQLTQIAEIIHAS